MLVRGADRHQIRRGTWRVVTSPRTRAMPRELHPGVWWLWAIGMATAASRTTNPILLGLIIAVLAFVVSARRGEAPWSTGYRAYIVAALVVIAIRVGLRVLLDGQYGETVLFRLPEVPLPEAAAGIRLGGPVALEGVLGAFYEGLRLATLLLCFGAANVLANAKRLLKSTPSALHEIGVAVTVALTIAPQLIESARRVHRARKLRSTHARGFHVIRQIVIPVMTDALDRSLALAAAMDARGFGRTRRLMTAARRRTSGLLVLGGLCGVCVGTYALLDASGSPVLGAPALAVGLAVAAIGMVAGGRRVRTTQYRPGSLEAARMVGGRVGDPGRGRDVRHRPGRSRRPQPVAATAALAGAPGVLRDRRPRRRTACVARTATRDRRGATA